MTAKWVLRNHEIDNFLICRRKYLLKHEGWVEKDRDENLAIGSAVHAALAHWVFKHDEPKAMQLAFEDLGTMESELADHTYLVLADYFSKYKNDPATPVATETDLVVPLIPDLVEIGMRTDGLVSYEGGIWVKETKTSGQPRATFWKRFLLDRQTQEYLWGWRQRSDLPIKGVMVDALFKPNQRNPEPAFERQFFTPTDWEIERWVRETRAIAYDLIRATENNEFYGSGRCQQYGKWCEFYDYCTTQENSVVLQSTHRLETVSERKRRLGESTLGEA